MSKEYYYLVRWTEEAGWELAGDIESEVMPDGTIFDTEEGGWQLPYLGDGVYNGKEEELSETLQDILGLHNQMKGVGR